MSLLGGEQSIRMWKAKVALLDRTDTEVTEILPFWLSFLSALAQVLQHLQVPDQKAIKYHSSIGKEVVKPTDEAKVKAKGMNNLGAWKSYRTLYFCQYECLTHCQRRWLRNVKKTRSESVHKIRGEKLLKANEDSQTAQSFPQRNTCADKTNPAVH